MSTNLLPEGVMQLVLLTMMKYITLPGRKESENRS